MDPLARDASAVLAAALALLDDYEATLHDQQVSPTLPRAPRRRSADCHDEELARLRASVDELRIVFDACRRSTCVDKARLWASVAINQLALRVEACRVNAQLHRAVHAQWRDALRPIELLSASARLPPLLSGITTLSASRTLEDKCVRAKLRSRLDAVIAASDIVWRAPCRLNPPERNVQVDPTGVSMNIHSVETTQYPFKLSLVANVVWQEITEAGPIDDCSCTNELFSEFAVRQVLPSERMEARVAYALRRVFMPDGSVAFGMASLWVPLGSEDSKVLTGLQFHATFCRRFGRMPGTTRVRCDTVRTTDVEVVDGRSLRRLGRFHEFDLKIEEEYASNNCIENKFLDESIAQSRLVPQSTSAYS